MPPCIRNIYSIVADLVKSVGALGVVEEEVGDGTVEGPGEGVEGAESRGVGAAFDTNEGYATDTGGVGQLLLGHACLFAEISDTSSHVASAA